MRLSKGSLTRLMKLTTLLISPNGISKLTYESCSDNGNKQFRFQNELALLVFLRLLEGAIVLPTNGPFALLAFDVPHDVFACCHVPLVRVELINVDNVVEEIGLAMLSSEVLTESVTTRGSFKGHGMLMSSDVRRVN